MADFTAIQNNPISIDLTVQGNATGWSLPGDGTAIHTTCNSGLITNFDYALSPGHTYKISWVATALSSGNVQLRTPGSNGVAQTAPGIFIDTVTPTSSGFVTFFSNANATITGFALQDITNTTGTTIVYSALNKKWSDFRTFYPDYGWSLFENTITAKDGAIYFHENGTDNTNNFYGTAYQSIIQAVFAKNAGVVNTFEVLSYQANMLLVSTQGGITTPTGQATTLIDTDFIKQSLSDGVTSVTIYQNENVYSASLLNDENEDVINGAPLQANYIIVSMQTSDGSSILKLFSMSMKTSRKPIGNR